jgi:replication factor C subunit 2/4
MSDIVIPPDVRSRLAEYSIPGRTIPPLLFHGSPGTGKTSTIMSFIENHPDFSGSSLFINGSDERTISVVRTTIYSFATSSSLFCATPRPGHLRFLILDEVDYMDMDAQRALKAIVQSSPPFTCFCFICNYIHKVDRSLFLLCDSFSFANLPVLEMHRRLTTVCVAEGREDIRAQIPLVCEMYGSDMRSMIYYLQYYNKGHSIPMKSWKQIHASVSASKDPFLFLYRYICTHPIDYQDFFMGYGMFLISKHKWTSHQLKQFRQLYSGEKSFSPRQFIQLATRIIKDVPP